MTDLAHRVISSISWNLLANTIRAVLLLIRLVVLARWLPVEVFGVYGLASAITSLSLVFPGFGLGGAFLHRCRETADEGKAADVFFTLQSVLVLLWSLLLIGGALFFARGQLRTALICLTILMGGLTLTTPAAYVLIRRVNHRRLAVIRVLNSLLGTVLALAIAYADSSIWALLATDLAALAINVVMLHCWRPVRPPRICWNQDIVRYYLGFGSRNLIANVTERALDRSASLWTGIVLGQTALGFYSRAFAIANYPRSFLLAPSRTVLAGAYAELKGDRKELSRSVVRSIAALIRLSFLAAGILFVIAEEFVTLILTPKWLPMIGAFRILLLYAVLDPSRRALGDLFIAVGKPQELIRSRSLQLFALAGGLFTLGPMMGIEGVASSVSIALLVGLFTMIQRAKNYIDLSITRVLGVPTLAISIGIAVTLLVASRAWLIAGTWHAGLVKAAAFSLLYCGVLGGLEYKELLKSAAYLAHFYRSTKQYEIWTRDGEV